MIKAGLHDSGDRLTVWAEGHALFAPEGNDIVCAAVSVLLQAWVNSQTALCKAPVQLKRDRGLLFVEVIIPGDSERLLFKSLLLNLKMMEKQHPDNIKVLVEE